ncbi:family 16 glycoside hydrolase [Marinimicrobium alkaliphilum]|uniref:family 16 glycoside hydrolase n=1 Tax=Marinimicrobium alkaliphilum TaxID=2202654 RepID=UPI000DB99E94|nr:family 16 glycoside hydrolase [Marinimicrobium alkaliphilum]
MRITKTESHILALLGCMSFSSFAATEAEDSPLRFFETTDSWQLVEQITLDNGQLHGQTGDANVIAWFSGEEDQAARLRTPYNYRDSIVRLEFMLPEAGNAGVYIHDRYGINLADSVDDEALDHASAGGLEQRWNQHSDNPGYDGVAPLTNAALPAGEWQTLEISFRAPRYDDADNKVDNALFLSVRLNGEQVHTNTIATGFTKGAATNWEQPSAPFAIQPRGPIALRNVDVRPADFSAVAVPEETGQASNRDDLVDFVERGRKAFSDLGCASCHAINKGDTAERAGPNLYGLFQPEPRDREVVEGGERFVIKANRSHLRRSIREPTDRQAVREREPNKGQAYAPIMPPYSQEALPDIELDAIGAYLETLNDIGRQGPVVQLVEADGPVQYDPMADGMQLLVNQRVRIQRGPMPGLSGRSIHVGQPNRINFTFDPRILGVARIWQGGFLDMSGEFQNRGGGGLRMGYDSTEIDLGESATLFAPLNANDEMIDFSFREAVFRDYDTIRESLYSEIDFDQRIAEVNAAFNGYTWDSADHQAPPSFYFRIGENQLRVQYRFEADGRVRIVVSGQLETSQTFLVNTPVLGDAAVSGGELEGDRWQLPAGERVTAELTATLPVTAQPWAPAPSDFDFERQALKTRPAEPDLPAGYSAESWSGPQDNFGRDLLFEALGIDVARNGTIVVATRTAGIWRIVDGHWELFAEGLFDSLGVVIEDDRGDSLVVGQKAELTRVADTTGDGRADTYQTLFDGFSFHSNYHTYMHGPVRGGDGAYYFAMNLAHDNEAVYKADGEYMGSQGGYNGWAFRVTPNGEAERYAFGLRSPAGFGVAPDGQVWYTENQGEFVSTSKLFTLERDTFYGHPSALVDKPGLTPDSPELAWEKVADTRAREVLLFPQNKVANSPGHIAWDTTEGKFGPFGGHLWVGDQTQSNLLRLVLEEVNGVKQGAIIPFAANMESGVMRPVFLPDGSLLIGQTGRGWRARGGHVASLQRIVWDGETLPESIYEVSARNSGFDVTLTWALPREVTEAQLLEALRIESWTYRDAPDYGSPELDGREEKVAGIRLSSDRRSLRVELASAEIPDVHPQQVGRVYHLSLATDGLAKQAPERLHAYYTLHQFRKTQSD